MVLGRHVIALMALLAFTACGGGSGGDAPGGTEQGATSSAEEEEAPLRFNVTERGYNEGSPDAPIRVVEFSDFACPHCGEFHRQSYPTVHEEFVETGTVLWKYIPYVLGVFPNSVEAARAGECAIEQDGFPALRDRLFEEQTVWIEADDPRGLFMEYASEEGLDVDRFSSCLEEGRRDEAVQENIELGRQVGIRGTPTFMVEGMVIQGNRPPEVFRDVFNEILEESGGPEPAVEGAGVSGSNGADVEGPSDRVLDGVADGSP